MSQSPAPHRRTAQILQHGAIVVAGMSSVGLTVAAATYAVNSSSVAAGDRAASRPAAPAGPGPVGVGLRAASWAVPATAPSADQVGFLPAGRFELEGVHHALTVPFVTLAPDLAA
ncbi:hypothetical protein [Nocardia stercoris]|uniref:Uncharacterized protein n=1 Tax=Nocardia stercoris TaxID=2483361 RepID=A0A3M2LAJ9_9NOCA|nr:hypothetical protein [Nocardia stercoris]RMI34056.1 hypothetical protein EBN03_06355 [Nocardia stercoris]